MNYVLCILFSPGMNNVLLIRRNNEPFKGLLNAPGGKINKNEFPIEAFERELKEETNINRNEYGKINYLMKIQYPSGVELNVFYVVLLNQSPNIIYNNEEGLLGWYSTESCLDMKDTNLAGEGNLSYFINYALILENGGKLK